MKGFKNDSEFSSKIKTINTSGQDSACSNGTKRNLDQ